MKTLISLELNQCLLACFLYGQIFLEIYQMIITDFFYTFRVYPKGLWHSTGPAVGDHWYHGHIYVCVSIIGLWFRSTHWLDLQCDDS